MDLPTGLPLAALQKLQSGVLVVDAELCICYINPWLIASLQDAPAHPEGMNLLALFPSLSGSRLLRSVQQALTQGLPSVLSPGLNPHPLPLFSRGAQAAPTAMAQSVQIMQLRLVGAVYGLITITDVSASMRREALLREQADKLSSLSLTDELTGIANRRRLNQHIDEELRRAVRSQRPLSVILLDIDHFKGYNDHFGHLAGDDCLIRISQTLQTMVMRAGDLLARYGGEEFCVVLAETDADTVLEFAESLRHSIVTLGLAHPTNSTGHVVTISLGVATFTPSSPDSPTSLLLKADRALYQAKQNGRNRSVPHTSARG